MNDCIGAPAHEWLERYVDGTLPEQEKQQFEDHYFDCPVCLGELQAVQAAQEQLRRHPVNVAPPRARIFSWPVMVTFGAMAATLAIAVTTFRVMREHPHSQNAQAIVQPQQAAPAPAKPDAGEPAQEIAQLADLSLPPYRAATLRDGTADAAFEQGMRFYTAGNCPAATTALSKVDSLGPDGTAAAFYLGVCRMNARDFAGAASQLHHVAFGGESPQLESAWYYLAQIALANSDLSKARLDLNRVISLHGDLEARAEQQLSKLPSQLSQ